MAATCYLQSLVDGTKLYPDVDPLGYDDSPPARRVSSHVTDGGTRVWQDFGVADGDGTLSVPFPWMAGATVAAFEAAYRTQAAGWLWHDPKGHEYLVLFSSLRSERLRGQEAYRVQLEFAVLEVRS
ncbi:MAG: hypothetical protein ACE149_06810 [Armatimonadota bacterium]